MKVPFNIPYRSSDELKAIKEVIESASLAANGSYTKRCISFFKQYGFPNSLLTTSCTDALELAAILSGVGEGDEVIVPSYTYPSTANAFMLRGATIRFADSEASSPNISVESVKQLLNSNTKVIVAVHYAGIACDMDELVALAKEHDCLLVEDAAQAIDSYHKGSPLGSIGDLGAISFHQTKNITSGEGGLFIAKDKGQFDKADILADNGTNRSAFFRGEVERYGWQKVGSSFKQSDVLAAYLWSQLQDLEKVHKHRKSLWGLYLEHLLPIAKQGRFELIPIPEYATNNGHMFPIICSSKEERDKLIAYLKGEGVQATFHYSALHLSNLFKEFYQGINLPNAERFEACLVRLPIHYSMNEAKVVFVAELVKNFYTAN